MPLKVIHYGTIHSPHVTVYVAVPVGEGLSTAFVCLLVCPTCNE